MRNRRSCTGCDSFGRMSVSGEFVSALCSWDLEDMCVFMMDCCEKETVWVMADGRCGRRDGRLRYIDRLMGGVHSVAQRIIPRDCINTINSINSINSINTIAQ